MSDDETFDNVDSGASLTFPKQAGNLKKGDYVLLKGNPCKISDIAISKAGKHGHAKAAIVGNDIFTDKKYEDQCPTSHNMDCPNVDRLEYMLIDIDEQSDFASLMDEKNNTREDLKVHHDELGGKIRSDYNAGTELLITVIKGMGQEKIVSHRPGSLQ